MTPNEETMVRAQARSVVYRLLAVAFLYPDQMTAAAIESGEFVATLEAAVAVLGEPTLGQAVNALRKQTEGFGFERWQSEYATVFGHIIPQDCPPYQTHYGSAHVFMQAQELADIAAFYRAFGMEVRDGVERVDHIAVELEFMGFLCFKEAYAVEHGHEAEKVAIVREAQRRFLQEHLGRWAPAFCRLLRKKAGESFYGALAFVTLAWIEHDMRALCVQAKAWAETDVRPVPDDLESNLLTCPFSTALG